MRICTRLPLVVLVLCGLAAAGLAADQRGRSRVIRPSQNRPNQPLRQGDLKPGDVAPDFSLTPIGGGPAVTLSSFLNRQPVALVFGSYT